MTPNKAIKRTIDRDLLSLLLQSAASSAVARGVRCFETSTIDNLLSSEGKSILLSWLKWEFFYETVKPTFAAPVPMSGFPGMRRFPGAVFGPTDPVKSSVLSPLKAHGVSNRCTRRSSHPGKIALRESSGIAAYSGRRLREHYWSFRCSHSARACQCF